MDVELRTGDPDACGHAYHRIPAPVTRGDYAPAAPEQEIDDVSCRAVGRGPRASGVDEETP